MTTKKKKIGRLPVNRGEYAEGRTYYKDNYVQYGGSTYCCTAQSTTQPPTDTSAWSLMAGGINEYILQQAGDDENKVMSQRAVTESYGHTEESPEWLRAYTDSEGKFLWGIKEDGSIEWAKGIPTPVQGAMAELEAALEEYKAQDTGSAQSMRTELLEAIDAKAEEINQSIAQTNADVEALQSWREDVGTELGAEDNPEYIKVVTDSEGKVIEGIREDGQKYLAKPSNQDEMLQGEIDAAKGEIDAVNQRVTATNENVSGFSSQANARIVSLEEKTDEIGHTDNPEFIRVVTDSDDKVLAGIKEDGSIYFPNNELLHVASNPEFLHCILDSSGHVLWGIREDGSIYEAKNNEIDGIREYISALRELTDELDGRVATTVADSPEYIAVTTDIDGKILEATTPDGKKSFAYQQMDEVAYSPQYMATIVDADDKIIACMGNDGNVENHTEHKFKVLTLGDGTRLGGIKDVEEALMADGFSPSAACDWSGYISNDGETPLNIPTPRCAMINLKTDYDLTQLSKAGYGSNLPSWPAGVEGVTYNIPILMEFWDMQGNYFQKKVHISGQGSSTMFRRKKNIAVDLFDGDWDGDAFSIRFGNWVAQDSFHLKAYDYEPFIGAGVWSYKLFDRILKTRGAENDSVWKKALLDFSQNTPTNAYGSDVEESSKYNDTNALCHPDGFPVVVYQQGVFHGVFSMQLKKHRDNYHMDKSNAGHIHLDGLIKGAYMWNGTINWAYFEVRNPKNLVYKAAHSGSWKYDADIAQAEIAGNSDGSNTYDSWSAGSYSVGDIVEHGGHYYLNTVAGNEAEPAFDAKNNSDSSPDFKNKTKCGWLNCTNTINVKNSIVQLSKVMQNLNALEEVYTDNPTTENLTSLKNAIEDIFDVDNLIDYIIINDIIRNDDAFDNNWQWTTYNGHKWYCNLYDCNISFGYTGGTDSYFRPPVQNTHLSQNYMLKFIIAYYGDRLNERWGELRENGAVTAGAIYRIVKDWIDSIGLYNLELENKKWSSVKSKDNIFRLKKWIDKSIDNLDTVYNYINN